MAKFKIPKDRSDADMLACAAKEERTQQRISATAATKMSSRPQTKEEFQRDFLSPELAQRIGELLLQIKMEYYREEIVDFSIEARKEGKNIVLVTQPKKHQKRI